MWPVEGLGVGVSVGVRIKEVEIVAERTEGPEERDGRAETESGRLVGW
jgi:hypothetical protein